MHKTIINLIHYQYEQDMATDKIGNINQYQEICCCFKDSLVFDQNHCLISENIKLFKYLFKIAVRWFQKHGIHVNFDLIFVIFRRA